MNTINPFSDDSFKKQLLEEQGLSEGGDDYEILPPEDSEKVVFGNIISSAPKIPSGVKNVILDASALAKSDKEKKAQELNLALNDVFTRYNKEYGTDLQIDFSSLSRTLVNVSDPKSRRTLELYLSEVFQSVRPVLILTMISKLSLAIDYILDPERMFGGELQLTDVWVSVEKILQFIQQLEDMKDQILIERADLELKKLGEGESLSGNEIENSEVIQDFMKLFKRDNGLNNE
jgi:hypothetical protein